MLVISAQDNNRRLAHGLNRLDGGIHIGSLAVVDVFHAVQFPHCLDPVLHAPEGLQAVPDHRNRYVHRRGDTHGAQRVLQVMGAGNEYFLCHADSLFVSVQPQHDLSVPDEGAFVNFFFPAEEQHLALNLFMQSLQARIVRVEHSIVRCGLVPEHSHFQGCIDLHGPVTVQVVFRNIRQQGHMGMESVRGLHLEGGNLAHDHVVFRADQGCQGEGISDVPHHVGHFAAVGKDFPQQGNRRGLSVRSRNRNQRTLRKLRRQFQFTDHIDSHFLCPDHKGSGIRNAGRNDQNVLPFQQFHRGAAKPAFQL